jgi:hypothetical protein
MLHPSASWPDNTFRGTYSGLYAGLICDKIIWYIEFFPELFEDCEVLCLCDWIYCTSTRAIQCRRPVHSEPIVVFYDEPCCPVLSQPIFWKPIPKASPQYKFGMFPKPVRTEGKSSMCQFNDKLYDNVLRFACQPAFLPIGFCKTSPSIAQLGQGIVVQMDLDLGS